MTADITRLKTYLARVPPGSTVNLHAKCVIVDDRFTLIGSANFTHNAMNRSIEVGVLVEDTGLATELGRQ